MTQCRTPPIGSGGVWATLPWIVAIACRGASAFVCESDAECLSAGTQGMCQPQGWCSFPDDDCASGHRFGDHAGDGLAGRCVPDGAGTDGSASTSEASATSGATTLTSTTSTTSTGSDTSTSTSGEATTTSSGSTTSNVSATDASSSTTDTGGPRCPTFVDDFDDGMLSGWTVSNTGVSEQGGALQIVVTASGDDAYRFAHRSSAVSLDGGFVRAHVATAPAYDVEQLYLAIWSDPNLADLVLWMIEGSLLIARFEDPQPGWVQVFETTYDPVDHAWLQIRSEDGELHFDVSSDGQTFVELAAAAPPFDLSQVWLGHQGGNYEPIPEDHTLVVERFEVCELAP